MAREILDRSKSYLELFTHEVEIDYSLPKYKIVFDTAKIDAVRLEKEHGSVEKAVEKYFGVGHDSPVDVRDIPAFNGDKKREFFRKENASLVVDKEFFESLTADDLTILIDEEKRKGVYRKFQNTINQLSFVTPDELFEVEGVSDLADNTIPTEQRVVREQLPGFWNRLLRKKKERVGTFRTDTNQEIFRNEPKPKPKPEKTYELDVMKFFDLVKLVTDQEMEDYYNRIGPYLVAMKKAKQMGQQALIDQLLSRIFIVKFESFLRAKGFHHKISEAQLVNFAKKTEKGVSLTYIKNFSRPIPDEVLQKKLEADSCHVFDNYVVLHYDPEGKVYAHTQEEAEKERAKKADPILFGIIADCRDLYYVTDWTDEYCDLTLDKFIEVSGLDKKSLEIGEKIKI